MSYANDVVSTCGRKKALIMYLTEDETKYIIECPICGEREMVDENA